MTTPTWTAAHIASLLMTFFYREMPASSSRKLYLAQRRFTAFRKATRLLCRDDAHKMNF
jgi:DNA gyrase/topoisomerase IV subunit B